MADVPVLVVTEGPRKGDVIAVREGGMTLGRAADNDVVIDHVDVSRFHARLLYDNGSLWVRDVGSRNGVFINDTRLADHKALKVGDRLRIADTTFEVRWDAPEPGDGEGSPKAGGPRPWWWPFGPGTTE